MTLRQCLYISKIYLRVFFYVILFICFLSGTSNSQWIPSPNLDGSIVQALTAKGNDVFAGTYSGGAFRSVNGGEWIRINSGLNGHLNVAALNVKDLRIFAGTFSGGIFYSDNNGENWIQ